MIIRREDFGPIEGISTGSHKKVWFTCDKCGIGILQAYRTYINQKDGKFCRSCRNSYTANRKDVKEKVSKSVSNRWKDGSYRNEMSVKLSKACKDAWDRDDGTRRLSIHNKTKYEYLKNNVEKDGYLLLTTIKEWNTPIKGSRKIMVKCGRDHIFNTTVSKWNCGIRCFECQKTPWSTVKESFEKEGYTLISKDDYKNNKSKLRYICPVGHEHQVSWRNWHTGTRCAKCSCHISRSEQEIQKFIEALVDCSFNDRSIIPPLELDIVVPSKNIAIEYNGLYWHSETNGRKSRNYHLKKLEMCAAKDFRLISIFEDEWLQNKRLIKDKLAHIIGCDDSRSIYARKCEVVEIQPKVASAFCVEHHVQGYAPCSIKLGAYYEGYLVAVMTFSKPSISKGMKERKEGIWELSRFCSKNRIIGIAGKLLEHFKRNYMWKEIYSFADRRWSDGNLYHKIGFELENITAPNYFYFYTKQPYYDYKRYHRFNFRKNVLKDKLELFDSNKTEYENMLMNGWDRIWDCGNLKFVMMCEDL